MRMLTVVPPRAVAALVLLCVLGVARPARAAATSETMSLTTLGVNVPEDDDLTRGRLELLARRSATAREMFQVLQALAPRLHVEVRAIPGLRAATGFHGLGRYRFSAGRLHGNIELDMSQSDARQQLESLAHELAHAVEIVCCLSGSTGRATLRTLLTGARKSSPEPFFETPFAVALGRQVSDEVQRNAATESALRRIAHRYGVKLPEAVARPHTR